MLASHPVVTVLFSNANVVCGEFFFSDSGCELVEPQTFSLSSKREAIVLESQGNMNVEGALVKASLVDMAKPSVEDTKGGDSHGN